MRVGATPGGVVVLSHDTATGRDIPVIKTGDRLSNDSVANDAYASFTEVQNYFATRYSRSGWDGKGAAAKVIVHQPDDDGSAMNNAYWDPGKRSFHLGDGDGKMFSPLGRARDVAAHEFTHAVVDSEVDLNYSRQEGGINESFADVLATGIDNNWLIGEDIMTPHIPGDAIRDLERPTYADARKLPPGADEVHDLSGIPSLAAVRTAKAVGADMMRSIWYSALVDHLRDHAGFNGAALATLRATEQLYGKGKEYSAVQDAWRSVGIEPSVGKAIVELMNTEKTASPRAYLLRADRI